MRLMAKYWRTYCERGPITNAGVGVFGNSICYGGQTAKYVKKVLITAVFIVDRNSGNGLSVSEDCLDVRFANKLLFYKAKIKG